MTREQRARNGARSVPGRDFSDLPGAGGGRRVVADPRGDRAARRAHQRQQDRRAGGRPVDVLVVDELNGRAGELVDRYAALAGIEVRPTGAGGVTAVCTAGPEHHEDGAALHALISASLSEPPDLADLAMMVAEHRAAHLINGIPLCTCRTFPADGTTRREIDNGCPEHGRVAQAFEAQTRYEWLIDRLARALGAGPDVDAFTADPEVVIPALLEALEAAQAALSKAETACRIHQDRDPTADAPAWHGGCEECRQPRRVRKALAAFAALAGYSTTPGDPWPMPAAGAGVAGELADVAAAAATGPAPSEVAVSVLALVEERLHALHPVERGGLFFVDRAGVGAELAKVAHELLGDDWADLLQAENARRRAGDRGPA